VNDSSKLSSPPPLNPLPEVVLPWLRHAATALLPVDDVSEPRPFLSRCPLLFSPVSPEHLPSVLWYAADTAEEEEEEETRVWLPLPPPPLGTCVRDLASCTLLFGAVQASYSELL